MESKNTSKNNEKQDINDEWDDDYDDDFDEIEDEIDEEIDDGSPPSTSQAPSKPSVQKPLAPKQQIPKKRPETLEAKISKEKSGDFGNRNGKDSPLNKNQASKNKKKKLPKSKIDLQVERDRMLEQLPMKAEIKLELEEGFEDIKKIFREKRRKVSEFFTEALKQDQDVLQRRMRDNMTYLEYNDDDVKEEVDVKRMKRIDISQYITFNRLKVLFRNMESDIEPEYLKMILMKLFCFNSRLQAVNFYSLLRRSYVYQPVIDPITQYFKHDTKRKASNFTKASAAIYVQKMFKDFKKRREENEIRKNELQRKKVMGEYDLERYSAEQMVEKLRASLRRAGTNPNHMIEMHRLQENDEVSFEKFKLIILTDLRFKSLSEQFLKQLFELLDKKRTETAPFREFIALMYSKEAVEALEYPKTGAALIPIAREAANANFDSPAKFLDYCRPQKTGEIRFEEFYPFLKSFSRFNQDQALLLFNTLNTENLGHLNSAQVLRLYESSKKSSRRGSKNSINGQDERFKSFLDMSAFGAGGGADDRADEVGMGSMIMDQGQIGSEFEVEDDRPHTKENKDLIEELILKLSVQTYTLIKFGQSKKDLFQMFADKLTRKMNLDEFTEAINYILKESNYETEESTISGLYYLFAWPYSKKITFQRFNDIIEMGRKMNPLYIKVKNRYGRQMEDYRELYSEQLQKLTVRDSDSLVPLSSVLHLLLINKIELTDVDCEFLKEEGAILMKDRQNFVDINQFINKLFPIVSIFDNFIREKSVRKLQRWYHLKKLEKLDRKNQGRLEFLLMQDSADFFGGGGKKRKKGGKKGKKGRANKKGKGASLEEDEILGANAIMRPAEIFELQGDDQKSNLLKRVLGKQSKQEERMNNLLVPKKTSAMSAKMRIEIEQSIRRILQDVINKAVSYGESLQLSKKVQRRYTNRPVIKDVFVVINEAYFDVVNVVPRSLSSFTEIGRMLYLNNEGNLHQYDLINRHELPTINLSSRIPSKKTKILDYLLDQETGNLYILKKNWDIEMWDIFQEKRSPKSRVRLIQSSRDDVNHIDQMFKNRHLGVFPQLLSLSENREYLIVNATVQNTTVFILDPMTLSILNQMIFKLSDFQIPEKIYKIYYNLKPIYDGLAKQQLSFEKIFAATLKNEHDINYISLPEFKEYMWRQISEAGLAGQISSQDLTELARFADQDNDGRISESEWTYIADQARYTQKTGAVHANCEIPEELQDLSLGAANIFTEVYEFIREKNLSVKDALTIFDDGSGKISVEEFFVMLDEISPNSTLEDRRMFFEFVDKSRDGFISIEEFNELFGLFGDYTLEELLPQENPRTDIYTIIERAYSADIDLEKQFQKFDEFNEGSIDPQSFRFMMKALPLGIGDPEVDAYFENSLEFTNSGNVSYLNIINSEKFKRIKYVYYIRKGLKEYYQKLQVSQEIERYKGMQKVVLESVQFITSLDVVLFTTISPKTSTIFLSKLKERENRPASGRQDGLLEQYECTMLGRLVGHTSCEPPTIYYVKESGCLISGEKYPSRHVSLKQTREAADTGGKDQTTNKFYRNIQSNKQRACSIMIWNVDLELFQNNLINPPWTIRPSRIIHNAHYDSIISIAYLSSNQLIVTSSTDGCIKFWDPIAKPYQLTHSDTLQQLKPGYFTTLKQEETRTSSAFTEVKRIYTGELVCYNLCPIYQRVVTKDSTDMAPKYLDVEYLAALELGKPQRVSGKLRSQGVIKLYGIERMSLEIPVCKFEEPIPKQLWTELEDLAIKNREICKVNVKRQLPLSLEKLNSKLVIHNRSIHKIGSFLKNLSLKRFSGVDISAELKQLFAFLTELPFRDAKASPQYLAISEIYMHLKRNGSLFPKNISKDAFQLRIKTFVKKGSRYLVDQRLQQKNKVLNRLSELVARNKIDLGSFFEKSHYSWIEMRKELAFLEVEAEQFEQFFAILDPFYSNVISVEAFKELFVSEIVEAGVKLFARPNFIFSKLNSSLTKSSKMKLLRNLFEADVEGEGRIGETEFRGAFAALNRGIDEMLIRELFEHLGETTYEGYSFISLSLFCKKLLTHSEQFELARVYNVLAKIKNALRFRMVGIEYLFMENEQEFKGKSLSQFHISISVFKGKIKLLKIAGLKPRDLDVCAYFLSTVDEQGASCITYNTMQSYFRKIDLRFQYMHLGDYKLLVAECRRIVDARDEFRRIWGKVSKKEIIGYSELRLVFNHFGVNEDILDLMLIKFADQDISNHIFLNKISSFCEMNKFLEQPKKLTAGELNKLGQDLFPVEQEDDMTPLERAAALEEGGSAPPTPEEGDPKDVIDELVEYLEEYENKACIDACEATCRQFDEENTGRILVADFVNILVYNLATGASQLLESLLLKLENNFFVERNMSSLEYGEVFEKVGSGRPETEHSSIQENQIQERNLTDLVSDLADHLKSKNFSLEKAFNFFDSNKVGVISPLDFQKVLKWLKFGMTAGELNNLLDSVVLDDAISHAKLQELLEFHSQHINVRFDPEIWMVYGKQVPLSLFDEMNKNLENLSASLLQRKDPSNPLVSAITLEDTLRQQHQEFNNEEIERILKYGVVGSLNQMGKVMAKIEKTSLDWTYEYVHVTHFLKSIPEILQARKGLPENKESARGAPDHMRLHTERENQRIINKVKNMLHSRGVTMWESLLSCQVSVIEGRKLHKNDFLRMMRIMNLDLTMKEKASLLNVLLTAEEGGARKTIDLHHLLKTFENEQEVSANKSQGHGLLLEKMLNRLYYKGYSIGRAFDFIDEKGKGIISKDEFTVGLRELDLGLSVFEINTLLEILDFSSSFIKKSRSEFKKKVKKLQKKYKIHVMENFSVSLLSQIENLISNKHKNLLENFEHLDLHKSGMADLKMLRKALVNFGLPGIRKHDLKTLIKIYKSDSTRLEPEEQEDEPSEEAGPEGLDMTLSLGSYQAPLEKTKVKKFDIEDENFKIEYKGFVERIHEAIEVNADLIKASYGVLRKVYTMTKIQELTLFETFVYLDVNHQNQVSNMETRLGLQNLDINLAAREFESLWKVFEKNENHKINFHSFFSAFLNAGCLEIVKFDDEVTKIIKKFSFLICKHGNAEETFRKFDPTAKGYVTLEAFRTVCDKFRLNLSEEETEAIFRVLCSPAELGDLRFRAEASRVSHESSLEQKPQRSFNFRRFAAVLAHFRKKDHIHKALHKLDSMLHEKGITFKQIFREFKQKKGARSKKRASSLLLAGKKKGIPLSELKDVLRRQGIGLNHAELDNIIDAFDVEVVSFAVMEKVVRNGVMLVEREFNQKNSIFERVIDELQETLIKENMNIEKIFFDFDSRTDGTLNYEEFNQMFNFLKIRLNKKEVKVIFDEIDFEAKGYVSFKEFQTFFDQNMYRKTQVEQQKALPGELKSFESKQLDHIIKHMQECAQEQQTSLENEISTSKVSMSYVVSAAVVEKILMQMNCVLKRDELKKIIEAASRDGSCSYRDLADWGIKNKIDYKAQESLFPQFPPAVQVVLSKMLQIFRKMDLQTETSFNYFTHGKKDFLLKPEFLCLVQGLQIPTNEEELLGLYNFFDERNYTEISRGAFSEKCELAKNFYKWSQQDNDTEKKGKMTLTLRQHVMSALEKIHSFFMERKFNKTQIFAVFDKNSTGKISREDFIELIERLKIQIPLEHIRSSLNFLDPSETGVINITSIIKKMVEAIPDHSKNTYRNSQALTTLGKVVGQLKVHIDKFKEEYLELEKKLQISDILARNKTGVAIYDFYRLLSTYGIRLQENDKILLNATFVNKKKRDYFDTEMLYLSVEQLAQESGSFKDIEGEDMEYWEIQILRKVADRLKSMNLTLEKAFAEIDANNFGFVQKVDFKQLLISLSIDLSQKDIDLLLKRLATRQNPNLISLKEFRQRFWACFFEGKAQMHPLNIQNRTRQIAAQFLYKIKFELQMPLTEAWDRLDRGRVGTVKMGDLKDFLIEIKTPINKQDLGFLFNIIDSREDGEIDQYEFAEFWNLNLPADFENRKQNQKKLEAEVLGKIAKHVNKKSINLNTLFTRHDRHNQGYLAQDELSGMFQEMGINVNEQVATEIMKLIAPENPQRTYFTNFETALLRNGLKYISKRGQVLVAFQHKLVVRFYNSLFTAANKHKLKIHQLLKQFDSDYNGCLDRDEFFNLIRSFPQAFTLEEYQRLAQVFSSRSNSDLISIETILEKQNSSLRVEKKIDEGLCDIDVFASSLQHFDPTYQLFVKWSEMQQSFLKLQRYMKENRDGLRGFKLLGVQFKIREIRKRLDNIEKDLRLSMNFLKNRAVSLIAEDAKSRYIDTAVNDQIEPNQTKNLDYYDMQDEGGLEDDKITSSQQFQIEYSTVVQFNAYIKLYAAQVSVASGSHPSWMFLYPATTLRKTMKNGNFYEQHLKYEISLHKKLSAKHPDHFSRIFGVYLKQIGIEADEKELFVFHEVLSGDWVSLTSFIKSTGGLVRIPFLMASNAISKVIKFWFRKVLEIVDLVKQEGASLYWIRPDSFYVNTKTLQVKLCSLRGVARQGEDGTIELVSDIQILRNMAQQRPTPARKMREQGLGASAHSEIPRNQSLDLQQQEKSQLLLQSQQWEQQQQSQQGQTTSQQQDIFKDAFLPPEYFSENELNFTDSIDSWCLGALLYFMIFGEEPRALTDFVDHENLRKAKEPSDYIFFDFLNEEQISLILKHDYDAGIEGSDRTLLIHALETNSYQGIFDRFTSQTDLQVGDSNDNITNRSAAELIRKAGNGQTGTNNRSQFLQKSSVVGAMNPSQMGGLQISQKRSIGMSNMRNRVSQGGAGLGASKKPLQRSTRQGSGMQGQENSLMPTETIKIGSYIDTAILLLSWKPYERPSCRSLLNSILFKSDSYQYMQMRQFSSIAFFYRSPSKSVRENILLPLRSLSAAIIHRPHRTIGITSELIRMVDLVIECIHLQGSYSMSRVKEEFSKELMAMSGQAPPRGDGQSQLPFVDNRASLLMDSITAKINSSRRTREKSPNYAVIKFMFNYKIFDILLFLVLRHHSAVNEQVSMAQDDLIDFEQLENRYYSPIKGFKLIMQKLIFDLRSYDGACAPFVENILDLVVRFAIGEEFLLTSDILPDLETLNKQRVRVNESKEYQSINESLKDMKVGQFFNPTKERDISDKYWAQNFSREPYCFKSNNWSLYLNSIATSLLREALGDGGLGSAHHPVILDYVRFVTEKKRPPNFEGDSSIHFFNSLVSERGLKSVDYFNEIFVLCKNIVTLSDPNSGPTSLKVVINYVKTVLTAKNVDKIKAILDSRILLKCFTYLQTNDHRLRTSILELVKIVASSHSRDHLHFFEAFSVNMRFDAIKDMKLRSAEEIQKNFGLVAHFVISKEDQMNKENFSECVRNYFAINSRLSEKYMRELSACMITPSFTLALISALKNKTEILENKRMVLEIIKQLTNGPFKTIQNLGVQSLDLWPTCAKLLAVREFNKGSKQTEYLMPFSYDIFRNLLVDSRSELTKIFERVVGLPTLLKERDLVMPRKVSLAHLSDLLSQLKKFFVSKRRRIHEEINSFAISNMKNGSSRKFKTLKKFEEMLEYTLKRIICWLHFESNDTASYNVSILQDIIYTSIEELQVIYEFFSEYDIYSSGASRIMILCCRYFETLVEIDFEYFIFDTVNKVRGKNNLEWIVLQIYSVYNYHCLLELDSNPEEGEKLQELQINKIPDIEARNERLMSLLKTSASLRKYSQNRSIECGLSLQRILLNILERDNKEYNELLLDSKIGFFYSSLIQKQYSVLRLFIETNTENIHVISRYVEESNIRLRIFEAIIKNSEPQIRQELLDSQCIQRIASSLMKCYAQFDVSYYRSNYKFLPFRNFMPFRSEAVCMISIILWNKTSNMGIYSEMVNEFIKSGTFLEEITNLRQKKDNLQKLTALTFFSRLIRDSDKQILFILNKKMILEMIMKEFDEYEKLGQIFSETKYIIENFNMDL